MVPPTSVARPVLTGLCATHSRPGAPPPPFRPEAEVFAQWRWDPDGGSTGDTGHSACLMDNSKRMVIFLSNRISHHSPQVMRYVLLLHLLGCEVARGAAASPGAPPPRQPVPESHGVGVSRNLTHNPIIYYFRLPASWTSFLKTSSPPGAGSSQLTSAGLNTTIS